MAGHLTTPDGWTPEFPGQRPPFAPGNKLAVTHGAFSATRVDPIAQRIIEEAVSDPTTSYLAAPKFHAALWKWGVAEARVELISAWVDSLTIEQAANSQRGQTPPLELLRKWMATSLTLARDLGFTPASAARLGKDVASTQYDLARILSADDTP
jgi:hypothetical protein